MLIINGMVKNFNEKRLFNNFSFQIEQTDFITIIGSNGAGKSTLLNIIAGSLSVDEGEIFLDDENISYMKEHIRAKRISRVFQNPEYGTSPNLSILENLSIVINKNHKYNLHFSVKKKHVSTFIDVLKTLNLGLEKQLHTAVKKLSGGQRQALALVMATLIEPQLLLLDEHISALDPHTAEIIMTLTEKLVMKHHIPTLMVTHNMNDAIKYGNRLIMMDNGNIVLDIKGEEKKGLTQEKLIHYFRQLKDVSLSDRLILS